MKVKRCGFYTDGTSIIRKDVLIDWDLGFSSEAKASYIKELRKALGSEFYNCVDVTSCSPIKDARNLCPYYVKTKNGDTVKDRWEWVKQAMDEDEHIPGLYEYIYLNALKPWQIDYALNVDCFYDVFFNPDKLINTNARALAALQLLCSQGKYEYLEDLGKFTYWAYANIGCMIIDQEQVPTEHLPTQPATFKSLSGLEYYNELYYNYAL